jgi:hypothetical protein
MRAGSSFGTAALVALCLAACGWGHSVRMLRDARPFQRRQALAISAEVPAGKIQVQRGGVQNLYELQLSYCDNHFTARSQFTELPTGPGEVPGARLRVEVWELKGVSHPEEEPNLMLLRLRPGITLDLRLAAGVAEVQADLTALSVRRLVLHGGTEPLQLIFKAGNPVDLEQLRIVAGPGAVRLEGLGWGSVKSLQFYGGAGPATLDFSGPGPQEAAAFVDPGTGGIDLAFPKDLAVEVSGAGVNPESPPVGFLSGANTWVSANREVAPRHLILVLDGGSEDLRFRWLP